VNLQTLNTHAVANVGATGAAATVVTAIGALFALLANPTFLFDFYTEVATKHYGRNTFQLLGAIFGLAGALLTFAFLAYVGRPASVAADPAPASK
jgi:uncharacterized BrkB/YihY/UPF0761 family membrane protein